jgi:hypothetical protein
MVQQCQPSVSGSGSRQEHAEAVAIDFAARSVSFQLVKNLQNIDAMAVGSRKTVLTSGNAADKSPITGSRDSVEKPATIAEKKSSYILPATEKPRRYVASNLRSNLKPVIGDEESGQTDVANSFWCSGCPAVVHKHPRVCLLVTIALVCLLVVLAIVSGLLIAQHFQYSKTQNISNTSAKPTQFDKTTMMYPDCGQLNRLSENESSFLRGSGAGPAPCNPNESINDLNETLMEV